jgi:hypothetical protein
VYIFTDGSCEPDAQAATGVSAGYGAVMFDPEDGALETFGAYIQPDLMHILTDGWDKMQIVGQSELVPCVAAKQVWRKRLRGRLVFHYIDNEAAKCGLIKGTSPTRDSAWLINELWAKEAEQGSHSWFERVPSASNCADDPSRGRARDVKVAGRKATLMRLPARFGSGFADEWIAHSRV